MDNVDESLLPVFDSVQYVVSFLYPKVNILVFGIAIYLLPYVFFYRANPRYVETRIDDLFRSTKKNLSGKRNVTVCFLYII